MTAPSHLDDAALRTIFAECRQCGTCCRSYRKIALQPDEVDFIKKMGGHVGVAVSLNRLRDTSMEALIAEAKIEFTPGFNLFSGETGAGKSILIDALGIVLGNRASAEYIREGEDSFWVQAVFEITDSAETNRLLSDFGIAVDEDFLFMSRKFLKTGSMHRKS